MASGQAYASAERAVQTPAPAPAPAEPGTEEAGASLGDPPPAAPPRRQAPLQGANAHALQEDLDANWGG